MKLLYIFNINDNYLNLTKDNPYNLFILLSGIKNSSIKDAHIAYRLYRSISNIIEPNMINKSLKSINSDDGYQIYNDIHSYSNYFNKENSKLFVHNSYLVLKTNTPDSIFLRKLKNSKNFFVVNFQTKDYYWLNE